MHILFLTTHLNTGGITSYLYNLTKGLIKEGHLVTIASSGGDREKDFEQLGALNFILNIRTKSELSPKIYFALAPLQKYIKENHVNVIHAQTRVTQVMGQLLRGLTKTAYVSTCHGFFRTKFSRQLFGCWGDSVIAISDPVKEHLNKDFNVPLDKISLVASGIDLDSFKVVDEQIKLERRKALGIDASVVIGMIARLSDVKGQDILLRAMPKVIEKFASIQLLLVGEGKMEDDLKSLVKELKISNNVQFLPIVNKTGEMLSILDLVIVPSRQEGLGLSIMEAQACGIPVIGSMVGGIPTLIEDTKTGYLVEPQNPESLARAIIRVLKDKEQARLVGLAGREFIRSKYPLELMVNRTVSVYRRWVNL